MNTVKQLFNLTSSLPQRPKVSFTPQEIMEDIDVISRNEEYRNKLYTCINEKPPQQEHKFAQVEEYLKETQDLQEASNILQELSEKYSTMLEELAESVDQLKNEIDDYFHSKRKG